MCLCEYVTFFGHLADNPNNKQMTDRKRPMSLSSFEFYFLLLSWYSIVCIVCCWLDCFLFCESCVSQNRCMIHNIKHWCSQWIHDIMPYEFTMLESNLFNGTLCILIVFIFGQLICALCNAEKNLFCVPLTLFFSYLFFGSIRLKIKSKMGTNIRKKKKTTK